jgi:hypothetical protein
MRIALIILSILAMSCKKENVIDNPTPSLRAFSRNALTIKHDENASLMRNKILNSFVEEKFPSNNVANAINVHDELLDADMIQRDLSDYIEYEKNMSKLVVSFSDHLEIYFLPTGFPIDKATSILNLKTESGRVFRWIKHSAVKANPGGKFFLASVNLEDIVKNDQNFYQENKGANKNVRQLSYNVVPGTALEVTGEFDLYRQKETVVEVLGTNTYCRYAHGLGGDPGCGQCKYKMESVSNEYEKMPSPSITEIGLKIKLNEGDYSIDELKPELSERHFKFVINGEDRNVNFALSAGRDYSDDTKTVAGFDYNISCSEKNAQTTNRIKKKLEVSFQMRVLGRGTEFLKNVM